MSQSLIFSFAGDRNDVINILDWINVIHTYGKIYDLQWENPEKGEKYKQIIFWIYAGKAQENIQIIYRGKAQVEEIKEILSAAQRIFFLGFSYAKENLEAIGLNNLLSKHQYIYGTAVGFKDREVSNIKTLLRKMNPALQDHHIKVENELDCLGLLREYL